MSLRRHQSSILSVLILLAVTLLFFHGLAFSGMILGRGDVYSYFYPYWSVRSAAFQAGHIPLWSPDIFMGVPLLANSQLGTFYPLNWLVTPLSTPDAITVNLIFHVFWAMLGVYTLARRIIGLDHIPAILAGVLFGVGGYLSGQIEHINQLQALSWMPWLFLLFHLCAQNTKSRVGYVLLLAASLALQLLAGHPQTVFITLLGLGVDMLVLTLPPLFRRARRSEAGRFFLRIVLVLIAAGVIALLLASPQLIPTLELARQSNRSGGLNPQQAMAFSFNPDLIGRGLLPSYDGLLFGEYMAYSGIIGLGLAIVGVFSRQSSLNNDEKSKNSLLLIWIVLAVVALFLALGVYNPVYWGLASLPGFSFFRVPARWLALLALSVAILAGIGLQSLKTARPRWWVYIAILVVIGGLVAGSFLSDRMAVDVTGPALPTTRTLIGWGVALAILLAGVYLSGIWRTRYIVSLLCAAAVVELFLASQILPYNELVPPDTYTASRFTIRQLQAYEDDQTPPERLLSITPLQFDPGDVDALKKRYAELGMSDLAVRIALVDTKLREVLAPNLSLEWGVPSIDGFDGGLLPTDAYSAFTSLILPPGQTPTTDGRLREMLAQPECRGVCIPDQRWLNLTNTRYLITDKVSDFWQDDVAYDTTFDVPIGGAIGGFVTGNDHLDFVANAVDVLYKGDAPPTLILFSQDTPLPAQNDGQSFTAAPLNPLDPAAAPGLDGYQLVRFMLDAPQTIRSLRFESRSSVELRAITLVDTRVSQVFQQLPIGAWKQTLSSDIKLYENQTVYPRTFLVQNVQPVSDDAVGVDTALKAMRGKNFDPRQSAVVATSDPDLFPKAAFSVNIPDITTYTPEHIEIHVNAKSDGLLVLTDAYYPGWVATVNDQPAPIYRTDIMFRGVKVPAGESTVVFDYRPWWWPGIAIFGVIVWIAVLLALVIVWRRGKIRASTTQGA